MREILSSDIVITQKCKLFSYTYRFPQLDICVTRPLQCGAHSGQHTYCALSRLPQSFKTEPQAGPGLIRGKHEPNQSVINFLYGISLDDKMSGNTQGQEVAVATHTCKYTHARKQQLFIETGFGQSSVLYQRRNVIAHVEVLWRGQDSQVYPAGLTLCFNPPSKKACCTHTHMENKVYNHPSYIHTCAESFTLQGDEE